METLTSGATKTLATLRPGDQLRSSKHTDPKKQRVTAINLNPDFETIHVHTTQGIFEFSPGDRVAFPRRPKGETLIHFDTDYPLITDVYVGDIIPPKGGWAEGPTAWRSGLQVTDIQISKRYQGWIVSVKPIDGSAGSKMFVSIREPMFYSSLWTDNLEELTPADVRDPLKTASGRYKHPETGEVVRFAIKGRPGRRPKDAPTKDPFEAGSEEWLDWMLLDANQAHPSDPRK